MAWWASGRNGEWADGRMGGWADGRMAWWRRSALGTRGACGGRTDGTYGTDETNVSAFICRISSLARRNRDGPHSPFRL